MAGHGCDDQHARLFDRHIILHEMQQVAKGQVERDFLSYGDVRIAALHHLDIIGRALMRQLGALEHVHQREHATRHRPFGHRSHGLAQAERPFRAQARGRQHVVPGLIAAVEHPHDRTFALY